MISAVVLTLQLALWVWLIAKVGCSAWWLVLVDHIGYARFEPHELETLRSNVRHPPEWAKIFLVDPLTPDHAIEV